MIEFDELTHTYTVDGKVLPSVTTITGILSDIEYKEIDPEILKRAGEKGSKVHKAIEDYLLWGEYELEEKYEPYMMQFQEALEKEQFKTQKTEFMLTDGEICGTIDNMSLIADKVVIIDYKTTATIHKKLLEAQFGGYKRLCDANGIKVEKWYGLFLRPSRTHYKFIEIDPKVDIFNKCKDLYDYMKESGK